MNDNVIKIKRGLDIKINGLARPEIEVYSPDYYAVKPVDFKWLVPKLLIEEGDKVDVGTPLFSSKSDAMLCAVSPVSGTVHSIERGEKRVLKHIVIKSDNKNNTIKLTKFNYNALKNDDILLHLLKNGLWHFIIQRPFGCIADYRIKPKSIFISCFDSHPLAPDYNILMRDNWDNFRVGIKILKKISDCDIHLSMHIDNDNTEFEKTEGVKFHYFTGPHPSGNVGTQINHISPINKGEIVWIVSPQNLSIIGNFFRNGILNFEKVVALTGDCQGVDKYYKTIFGASFEDVLSDVADTSKRVISGNVLTGKTIDSRCFISFYDNQLSVVAEGGQRHLLGWLSPGFDRWSSSHTHLSRFLPDRKFSFTTSLNGSRRSMFLSEVYDNVFPMDILPMELLKSCVTEDYDKMESLGIYEVVEEDFALCEFVCPAKTECQQIIFDALTKLRSQL